MPRNLGPIRLIAAGAWAVALATVGLVALTPAASAAPDHRTIHTAYCQTFRYAGYVTLTERGVITPGGGGLVCYDGRGTADLDRRQVTRFAAGEHSGVLRYREHPGGPVQLLRYRPHRTESFPRPVRVESLTISS